MRRITLLIVVFTALCTAAWTQSVPLGMKYQAVARDLKGNVLNNQEISIKITLYSDIDRLTMEYSESHITVTNEVGLFTLVIGEGTNLTSSFDKVPWSTRDIWMEVSVLDSKTSEFITISSSKLLAVPYAFHAGTASELVNVRAPGENGVPANVWSLFGNSNTNEDKDRIGTTDCADFVFITNNLERLRITCEGVVNIVNDLNVGANLDVGIDAHIGNDLTVDQDVFLNVDGGNTTVNGDLTVANMSPTHLTGTLTVDKATDLNSSLNVDGTTTLNDDLTVTGMSPTYLTGTLEVDKATNLNNTLTVDDATDLNSTLNVDGATDLNSTLSVDGAADLNNTLNVDGTTSLNSMVSITDATQSTSTVTGALKVAGGVGVVKNVHIGGTLTAAGVTTINNTLNVNGSSSYVANFVNSTSANGISIQVAEGTPSTDNNFVTFKNSGGNTVGRVEGQTGAELLTSFDYIWFTTMEALHTAFAAALIVVDLIGVDDFDAAIVEGAELATAIAEWLEASINLALNVGVIYESGSGDYAEWLERENSQESFSYGDIVGVKGGKISKNMHDADKYMVISQNPIVLGNMPPADDKSLYEMVAFMGQVPVKVRGEVAVGDYIIPSELEDGFGKAVNPSNMTIDQYRKIVGIAWNASDGQKAFSLINVAVGINTNDVADKLQEQNQELEEVKDALNDVISYLQSKDPSFEADMFSIENNTSIVNETTPAQDMQVAQNASFNVKMTSIAQILEQNPQVIENVLSEAKSILDAKGIDYNRYEQTSRLLNDSNYFISMLKDSNSK